ncbi:hypothetical protein, partial [Cupriavidus gilardii]|uniref:hypothetical protein n=1 Tax=Cupriavidus gilardii TaxID=82541 RepID=UPI001BB1AB96
ASLRCQQQRNEIMQNISLLVNRLSALFAAAPAPQRLRLPRQPRRRSAARGRILRDGAAEGKQIK